MTSTRQYAPALLLSLAIITAFIVAARERNRLFQDPVILWQDVAARSPEKRRPRLNYGHVLIERQQFGKALEQLQPLSSMREDGHVLMHDIQRELSLVYFALGLNDLAIDAGKRGLQSSPGNAHLLTNIAAGYLKKRHYPTAVQYALAAHRADPALLQPLNILGEGHLAMKEHDLSLQYMLLALEREPDNALRYWNVAAVYEAAGRNAMALRYYSLFLDREPDPQYRQRAQGRMRKLGSAIAPAVNPQEAR